jgi:hypothetical protein
VSSDTHVRFPDGKRSFPLSLTRIRLGRAWWIRYSYLGKRSEESSGSDNQRKAEQLLGQRIQECKGRRIDPTAEHRVRMEDLFKALEKDYEDSQRRSALSYRLT